ncbi:MAG TPA: 4-alpha-glucanotransferase [Acidimicrobiales bacterium]|nr:4-alpha-glucanotransferase [Acidimicrobiales bacterium]
MTAGIDPDRWGVAPGFHDVGGVWREAPRSTIDAILESMGAGPGDPPPPALVTVRTDHPLPGVGRGRLRLEDGAESPVDGDLPAGIPPGYHTFEPEGGSPHTLIVSPGRVPYPDRPMWGFAAQLYATRSTRSWGIGDLDDLRELGEWAAGLGAGFSLVNPLHAPTPGRPVQPSPYYPGSRCFMNPLYIAVERVEGADRLEALDRLAAAGRQLNRDRHIDRDRVWDLKSEALEGLFGFFAGHQDFDRFLSRRGRALEMFAAFCALAERHGTDWRAWPAGIRHPGGEEVAGFARSEVGRTRIRYHSWLQWLLDRQAAEANDRLGLVADLAVGVDPSGPDSWIWQDSFAEGMRVGAPPDEFNTLGQDWGLPPFDPWRLRQGGYAPWIEALRAGMAHGAGLRVDHVMGLFRLYWITPEGDAGRGAYVRYPHDDLLNILTLEAHRAGAYVVGEDLGTVEDHVRRDLSERRVLSYRVWWFEDGRPGTWPEAAMGAVTTHDLPTVTGVLTGSDLDAQRRIGMEPNEEASAGLRSKLLQRSGADEGSQPAEVIAGVYRDLGAAPCRLLVASLDDVLAVEERPNMPGTTDAWPNWSIALPEPLERLEQAPLAAAVAAGLRRDRPS